MGYPDALFQDICYRQDEIFLRAHPTVRREIENRPVTLPGGGNLLVL
jgi:hypothetical protein